MRVCVSVCELVCGEAYGSAYRCTFECVLDHLYVREICMLKKYSETLLKSKNSYHALKSIHYM